VDSPQYPRWTSTLGLSRWAATLAESSDPSAPEILRDKKVISIESSPRAPLLTLKLEDESLIQTRLVLLTAPVPQALQLFSPKLITEHEKLSALEKIKYTSCLASAFEIDQWPNFPKDGLWRNPGFDLSGLFLQKAKGIQTQKEILVAHGNPEFSQKFWDSSREDIYEQLKIRIHSILDAKVALIPIHLHKWRYCEPLATYKKSFESLKTENGGKIFLAGDSFECSKIEGAFESGRKAAQAIIQEFKLQKKALPA